MTDLALKITNNNYIDLRTDNFNGIAYASDEIQTAVLLSLFTDCKSQQYNNIGLGAGWWGDAYNPYTLGSQLYTLYNSAITNTNQLTALATSYCNQSLQWLVTANKIKSFNVVCTMLGQSALGINVTIFELSNPSPVSYSYTYPIQ